jgi:cytochrome P450
MHLLVLTHSLSQLETLRLFPPTPSLPKRTSSRPQLLRIGDRSILIPDNTSPSVLAVHTHPDYWKDPMDWNPECWTITDKDASGDINEEVLIPRNVIPIGVSNSYNIS